MKSSVRTSIPAVRIPTASGAGKATAGLLLDVHIDTVGIETMIGDPFDGRLENGRVYGRGSVDTKASLGVVLALLEDMQRCGEVLKCPWQQKPVHFFLLCVVLLSCFSCNSPEMAS